MHFETVVRDGTRVVFREPTQKDAAQLMRYINRFVAEPRSGLLINRKVSLKSEKAWLKGWIEDIKHRRGVFLIVEVDGVISGTCSVVRHAWKSSHVAELGIGLSKDVRGKGIGSLLINRALELATIRMRGLEIIQLKAFSYNQRAQDFYKKHGFVEVARVPDINKEGTEYFDDVYMVKRL